MRMSRASWAVAMRMFRASWVAATAGRDGWHLLGRGVSDEFAVVHRVVGDCEFEHSVEDQPAAAERRRLKGNTNSSR
jgi:hypothetical protein